MQIAARNGCIPMLLMLHQEGGNLSSRGPKGDTLAHLAAYNGHVSTLQWLHEVGAVLEAVDLYGRTIVHTAARRGELLVLQYLVESLNMDYMQQDFDGKTAYELIPRRGPDEVMQCREYMIALISQLDKLEMVDDVKE